MRPLLPCPSHMGRLKMSACQYVHGGEMVELVVETDDACTPLLEHN